MKKTVLYALVILLTAGMSVEAKNDKDGEELPDFKPVFREDFTRALAPEQVEERSRRHQRHRRRIHEDRD